MTPESENFDALRRLLKVKRHEQPPPGYFNDFSRQVVAQIKAGSDQAHDRFFERLSWEVPWLQRLIQSFQAKPALAVGFGAAVCALLVGGVIYSESLEYQPSPVVPGIETLVKTPASPAVAPPTAWGETAEGSLATLNTNSSLQLNNPPGGSLFDQFRPTPQLVSDPLGGK